MREGIKTSLLSILCVVAAAAANAAPTVRTIGGTGTYDSAAAATAASRAGSLRSTGGMVRTNISSSGTALGSATAPVSGASVTNSSASSSSTTGGAVSTGGTTIGRVASAPRLSIGKYVGAPKSISSSSPSPSDLDTRLDKLERDVGKLETDKQDVLRDTTYITVQGDELILEVEKIREDLDLQDGREVEVDADNDIGVRTRYIARDGEDQEPWETLITWDELREKLNLDNMDQNITERITELRTEIMADLDTKLDKDQGAENAGRAMVVGADGIVVPSDVEFATTDDLDNLGALAYLDRVDTDQIDDGAVERAKLAAEISEVIDWIDWWRQNAPSDGSYVLSIDENGNKQWFRVITADEDSGGETTEP